MNTTNQGKQKAQLIRLDKSGVVRVIQKEFEKHGFYFSFDEIEEMWTDRSNAIGETWMRLPPRKNLFDDIILWWDRELTDKNSELFDRSYFFQLRLFAEGV